MDRYKRNSLGQFVAGPGRTLSADCKAKIAAAQLGKENPWERGENHYNWKGGRPNCADCGKQLVKYKTLRCKGCVLKRRWRKLREEDKERYDLIINRLVLLGRISQNRSKKPTSIEKTVYDYLTGIQVIFETQKLINNRFLVDTYIPSANLIIEIDGAYWHSLPKTVKKDKAENAYLKQCGFNLIRLTEREVKDGSFKERLVI